MYANFELSSQNDFIYIYTEVTRFSSEKFSSKINDKVW